MPKYSIVDNSGNVINVVEWDGAVEWAPPANTSIYDLSAEGIPTMFIGGTYVDSIYTPPPEPFDGG